MSSRRPRQKLEEYLLNWGAFLVQHPDVPAEVAIALIGPKGGGKGLFGNAIEGKGKDLITCPNRMHILVAAVG